jgi:hypothetical protein
MHEKGGERRLYIDNPGRSYKVYLDYRALLIDAGYLAMKYFQ